eukprot:4751490-Pleurochrysis_carterae.AAC.1
MCTRSAVVKCMPRSGASTHCLPTCHLTKYSDRWRRPNGTPASNATSALRKPLAAISVRKTSMPNHSFVSPACKRGKPCRRALRGVSTMPMSISFVSGSFLR